MRVVPVVSLALLMLAALLAGGPDAGALAQEGAATPPASEGARLEPVGVGPAVELTAGRAALLLLRLTIEPGGRFASEADPSLSLVAVEDGAVTARVEAPVLVVRLREGGAQSAPERVAAGTEFMAEPGASFLLPPATAVEIRNDEEEAAVLHLATLAPRAADTATPAP